MLASIPNPQKLVELDVSLDDTPDNTLISETLVAANKTLRILALQWSVEFCTDNTFVLTAVSECSSLEKLQLGFYRACAQHVPKIMEASATMLKKLKMLRDLRFQLKVNKETVTKHRSVWDKICAFAISK